MTNVTHLAIGWYLGDELAPAQVAGVLLVSVGVLLMSKATL